MCGCECGGVAVVACVVTFVACGVVEGRVWSCEVVYKRVDVWACVVAGACGGEWVCGYAARLRAAGYVPR